MLDIIGIFKKNFATFYDYRTGKRENLFARFALIFTASLILSLLFHKVVPDFYGALITVQSILVGFSFNIMVFLASRNIIEPKDKNSIEQTKKADRINALAREIFFNLSYFTIVCLFNIVISLSLIFAGYFRFIDLSFLISASLFTERNLRNLTDWAECIVTISGFLLLYLSFLESLLSFIRTIRRSVYFLEKKIEFDAKKPR